LAVPAVFGGVVLLVTPFVWTAFESDPIPYYNYLVVGTPVLLCIGLAGFGKVYGPAYTASGRVGLWLVGLGLLGTMPLLSHRTIVSYSMGPGILFTLLAILSTLVFLTGSILVARSASRAELPATHGGLWLPVVPPISYVWNVASGSLPGVRQVYYVPLTSEVSWLVGIFGLLWIVIGYQTWDLPTTLS
jgi:hypothetical protein